MNLRVIITLIATIVWFGIGWRYYTCNIKGFCGDEVSDTTGNISSNSSSSENQNDETTGGKYPISFKWGDTKPERGADFDAYIQALMADTVGGKSLTITGQHFSKENDPSLGIERAKQLRAMLGNYLDTNRIFVSAELVDSDTTMEGQSFESALFAWQTPEQSIIERVGNELTIYFPYKSTQRIADTRIDEVFEDLIDEIQQKKLSVELTGHTDNIGPDDYNIDLGQNRAQSIKDLFIEKGLDSNSIKITSQGESSPVGDNSAESGRRKNRRVEITIK